MQGTNDELVRETYPGNAESNARRIQRAIDARIEQGWKIADAIDEASKALGISRATALSAWLFGR